MLGRATGPWPIGRAGRPGADPASLLQVEEVVDLVRYLLHTGGNVKLGPEILLRTVRNPVGA